MNKRGWGEGSCVPYGDNLWRLRYRASGRRHSKQFRGTKSEAVAELRRLLKSADDGEHVDPNRQTVRQWIEHWVSIGVPSGKRRATKKVADRTVERYSQLLRTHVLPVIGDCRLQKLSELDIKRVYDGLDAKAPQTRRLVHIVLSSALGYAVRKKKLPSNPVDDVTNIPPNEEGDHGLALDEAELGKLVEGFRGQLVFPIVALAGYTGMRRNEILALRWSDFDEVAKTLKVERALQEIKGVTTFKVPKTKRGVRTIKIDDKLVAMLCLERKKMQRLMAGVPDSAPVDLSLVRLPANALMFPATKRLTTEKIEIALASPRYPGTATQAFIKRARQLGFGHVRFHDLRGSHATQLLRQRQPIDVVARRIGDDPATMLRHYAKHLRGDDDAMQQALAAISSGFKGA
jgi:integrase